MNEGALAPFTAAPGSPSRDELVARYEARTGREFDHPGFYRAFAAFSLGLVWADLHRASIEDSEDVDEKATRDPYGDFMALLATELCARAGI